MKKDIRWKQRFSNFLSAHNQLKNAVILASQRNLSDLEKQGIIQAFEFTHEIAWNVLKDYFQDQGNMDITGSKDAAREGFKMGLIQNGNVWMAMIKSRNLSSHTYNKIVADQIVEKIISSYNEAFEQFSVTMKNLVERV